MAEPVPGSPFHWDFWDTQSLQYVQLSCLMPNSIFISLRADRDMTLERVKTLLWMEAGKYPLKEQLLDSAHYSFECGNQLAARREIEDERVRLSDLKPTGGVLRLARRRRRDSDSDGLLDEQIGRLIGKDLREFEALNNEEVDDFRAQMTALAQRQVEKQIRLDWNELLQQLYPPRLVSSDALPAWLQRRLGEQRKFKVEIAGDDRGTTLSFPVAYKSSARKLVKRILEKRRVGGISADAFLLKVCGQREYLTRENCPLISFAYIQETLARDATPKFVAVEKRKIMRELKNEYQTPRPLPTLSQRKISNHTVPSFRIHDNFRCTVLAVSRLEEVSGLDVSRLEEVEVQACIYHGGKQLCEYRVTEGSNKASLSKGVVRWQNELEFPITIANIPRMARLCFAVIITNKGPLNKKHKKYRTPLAWVNTTIFEYNNRLRKDEAMMNMWPHPNSMCADDPLLPLGTVALNPNTDQCVTMTLRYGNYTTDSPIAYAPDPELTIEKLTLECPMINETLKQKIYDMKQNPFYEMHEQDWKDLWSLRTCLPTEAPELLPKLLQCAEWSNQKNVAWVNHLVNSWPALRTERVECALELLDYAYAEPVVRKFAVTCLRKLKNDELSLYLLQLIQALKHESYLMCDLVEFLLSRAFENMKIGHFIFWQLKSEMHNPAVNIRFGLIMEAYLRGSQHQIRALQRQVNCLNKLLDISQIVRRKKDVESARAFLLNYLRQPHCSDSISQFANTLNPSIQCECIIPEKCRVMDSKMRPLLLAFKNCDEHGDAIYIILKNGDDLRQDMFTLQILRIMDRLWKDEGYDFRLNPYGCIAMGDRVGMIEVVHAKTIANIQKEKGRMLIKSDNILLWLKEKNDEENLDKVISEFMWSCAGYCVATYVLGIADRHSDNIMVKECGQLFHIDFGHILGNYKEMFGLRRERVPFVLAHEFLNVINHGKDGAVFGEFRKLCEDAYMVLRRHGMLIASLFAMMISTGLPELSSEEDLNYLKDTLALEATDEEAKIHFHSKFDEALRNDFFTKANWMIHNFAKNN